MRTEKEFEQYLENIKQLAAEEGFDSLDPVYVAHLKSRFLGESVVIGTTSELVLRELKPEDLEGIYGFSDAYDEPVLESFLKETKEESRTYLEAYIQTMYPLYDYGIWAVELQKNGELIGLCGIGQTSLDGEICTDLGYYICPKCRKKGFASQCVEFVLDYAKNYLEIPLIYAIIKEENRISAGILRKFGFQETRICDDQRVFQKDLAG